MKLPDLGEHPDVLTRGTILATGTGADVGKLVMLTATTEAKPMASCWTLRSTLPPLFGDGS